MAERNVSETGEQSVASEAGLKKLLEQNLETTSEVLKLVKKIHRYIVWQRIFGLIYFILIVVPIILALIYLPPLLKQFTASYGELLAPNQKSLLNQLDSLGGQSELKNLINKLK